MNKTTKLLLTGVTTIGILGIGTAGAMAMTSSLGVKDQAGTVQSITPVTTGSASSTPSASPTPVPTGATTVAPAAPVYLDDKGGERSGASDDSATHEVGDDNGVDPSGHDATDDKSGDSSKSGSDSSTSDSSKSGGSTSGSSDSGSSGSDGGSHN